MTPPGLPMKAIRIHEHGGVEQLWIEELAAPQPGPRQILVEVRAAALNQLDLWVRKGIPGVHPPLILGSDAAGVVRWIDQSENYQRRSDPEYVLGALQEHLG